MKVAYCLSGLARENGGDNFTYTKEGILDKWDVDTFISVWNRDYTGCFPSGHEEIIELYNPKIYRVDEPLDLVTPFMNEYPRKDRWRNFDKTYPEVKKYRSSWGRTNVLNMYYQIYNCNQLVKMYEKANNFKYDVVIRARADGGWAINHELLRDPNTVYLHGLKDVTMYSDWFAYGSSEVMDKYSSVWLNIQQIARGMEDMNQTEQNDPTGWYYWLDPHKTLKAHLATFPGLKVQRMERADIRSQGHIGIGAYMKREGLE